MTVRSAEQWLSMAIEAEEAANAVDHGSLEYVRLMALAHEYEEKAAQAEVNVAPTPASWAQELRKRATERRAHGDLEYVFEDRTFTNKRERKELIVEPGEEWRRTPRAERDPARHLLWDE